MEFTSFLDVAILVTLGILAISFLLTSVRIIKGPTVADRIVALDMLVSVGIAFIAVIGAKTNYYLYIDIAIALALVGFLSTVAFTRFMLHHGDSSEFINKKDAAEAKAKAALARKGD